LPSAVTIGRLGAAVEIRYTLFTLSPTGEVRSTGTERVDYLRMDSITTVSFDPLYTLIPQVRTTAVHVEIAGLRGEAQHYTFVFRPGKDDEAREVADVLAQTVFVPPSAADSRAKKPAPNK